MRDLLDEQFDRLSDLEQTIFCWLAILREPVSLEDLLAVFSKPRTDINVLEALDGLLRRSLIERGQLPGNFTLQSVVLEYATGRLIEWATSEIEQGRLACLIEYGLCQAQAKEYVRETQERLFVVPLLARLQSVYRRQADLEARLLSLLDDLRNWDHLAQGYGPANLIALLGVLRGDLRGLDLSRLALRGAFLQGVQMQDTTLSGATLRDSVFTESFDAVTSVAASPSGPYWAAGNWRGEVRVWAEAGQVLHWIWQAHTDTVQALAFGPDGRTLVSVSWDSTIKLWNVESGMLLWEGWQTGGVYCVAIAPDGHLLASGGYDGTVRLWDPSSGTNLQTLPHSGGYMFAVTWSPDGHQLASGCADGSIWVWKPQEADPATHVQILTGHTQWVTELAFSPDSAQLASASFDSTIKLWDMQRFVCLQTFSQQTDQPMRVAWSPDGRTLASAGIGQTIRLWDVTLGKSQAVLRGHSAAIYSLAITADSRTLLSGSDDGTLRVWDVDSRQCLRIIGGYAASLFDIDWSPDGTQLVSGGADTLVTVWDVAGRTAPSLLRGHSWIVYGVAWSPDGHLLASGGYDSIRFWDPATGVRLQVLQGPDATDFLFRGVAWSPDGHLLASVSYQLGVQVWEMTARIPHWIGQTQQSARVRRVAWNPDGTRVVGGSDDGCVYVWDASDGTLLHRLEGHHGTVWSPDGRWLASSSGGREGGELFVWEAGNLERVRTLAGHPGAASAVAWSPFGGNWNPAHVAMAHDLMRSLKRRPFWVMEQQAGPSGWGTLSPIPLPGEIRPWSLQSFARGAEGIIYFRWRTARVGAEQHWHGILPHHGQPGRRYEEVCQTGEAFQCLREVIPAALPTTVALMRSYETLWAFEA